MVKTILTILFISCGFITFAATNIIQSVTVDENGNLKIDDVSAHLRHFDGKWNLSIPNRENIKYLPQFPVIGNGSFDGQAKWTLRNKKFFDLHQQVRKINASSFTYSIDLKSPENIPTKTLCLDLILSGRIYAGKKLLLGNESYTLPLTAEKKYLVSRKNLNQLIINGGKRPVAITGKNIGIFIQDNRKSGRNEFELRIMCNPANGKISHSRLNLTVSPGVTSLPNISRPVSRIKVDYKGIVEFNDINLIMTHYNSKWHNSTQGRREFEVLSKKTNREDTRIIAKWVLTPKNDFFNVTENVQKTGPGSWNYSAMLESATGIKTNNLCVSMSIPANIWGGQVISIDGQDFTFPVKYKKMTLLRKVKVKKIILYNNSKGMLFEGNLDILLQDNRKFNSDMFELRIMFSPDHGDITRSSISFDMKSISFKSEPVAIRKQVNMGFRDKTADDKKGGWTDQGPENDLGMIKPGVRNIGGVTFDIIDPNSNNGKSCMVFSGKSRNYFLDSTEIKPETQMNRYLYLLHAIAWAPREKVAIGKVLVEYADGDQSTIDIINKRDTGNWWEPVSLANGIAAWTAENRKSYVGLYLSKFALKGKKIKKISLLPRKNAVWMVAGLSMSNDDIPINNSRPPYYIVPCRNWTKIADPNAEIIPGSPLDFSSMLDAPAGKYGKVVIRNGHFEFEKAKGKKVRFYGNNLCFSAQYLDKKTCEKVAAQFAAIGYNSVRFHHYDNNLIDKKAGNSTTLDKSLMDKLDYLFHCFKRKGIYITTDLFCSRRFKAGEVTGFGKLTHYEMKALAPINEDAFNNWKAFSRKLLTHKNPYTGMSWAEDPALFAISVVNEDAIYHVWQQYPAIKEAYLKKFDKYLQNNNIDCKNDQERSRSLSKFLIDIQIKSYLRMKDFLKNELKVQAQLSDANFTNPVLLAFLREKLDYVDNHAYWDHPSFIKRPWSLPHRYKNISAIKRFAEVPRHMMPSRIMGKPFMVTEFNYCFPNNFRAEGGVLMGAYASLQDWDGLYRFAYSHNIEGIIYKNPIRGFDLVCDPLNMLSEKMGILLFLRQDVASSQKSIPFLFGEKSFDNVNNMNSLGGGAFPEQYSRLGLFAKIGTAKAKNSEQHGYDEQIDNPDITNDAIKSSTGELYINRDKVGFSSVTPQSEIFIADRAGEFSGKSVSVINKGGFCVAGAASMDGKKLNSSRKFLLFHLTDIQNSNIKFMSSARKILLEWGKLPLLMKRGEVTFRLKHQNFNTVKVWALSFNGRRTAEIPATVKNGAIIIDCNNANSQAMVYEVIIN